MAGKGLVKRAAEWMFEREAALAAGWASAAHRRLLMAQWGLPPAPEHFDHRIDLFHQWLKTRNPLWLERGVFSLLALKGGDVLELSCGDGFNTRNFYSLRSSRVVGCDIDPAAIATARRKNAAANVDYVVADLRQGLPPGAFENVIWDFAFPLRRYFSAAEIGAIVARIRQALASDGVFSGYTMAETDAPAEGADADAIALRGPEDLRRFLAARFRNVAVFETTSPDRRNLYFWASDGALPCDPAWPAPHGGPGAAQAPGR